MGRHVKLVRVHEDISVRTINEAFVIYLVQSQLPSDSAQQQNDKIYIVDV